MFSLGGCICEMGLAPRPAPGVVTGFTMAPVGRGSVSFCHHFHSLCLPLTHPLPPSFPGPSLPLSLSYVCQGIYICTLHPGHTGCFESIQCPGAGGVFLQGSPPRSPWLRAPGPGGVAPSLKFLLCCLSLALGQVLHRPHRRVHLPWEGPTIDPHIHT